MARTFVSEGPDLVGKSTTVKAIAEANSFRIERNVAVKDAYQLVATIIDDIERARMRQVCGGTVTLFDRWQLISDLIYSEYVYKESSRLAPLVEIFLDQCTKAGIVFLVFKCSDLVELEQRYVLRGDDERTFEEIKIIQDGYINFFTEGVGRHLHHVIVDTAYKTPEDVTAEVQKSIKLLGGF